jgi:hypothetical protein
VIKEHGRIVEDQDKKKVSFISCKVNWEWESRGLHNEERHNLHAPPSITGVIKLRRMRRAGHVARMGDEKWIQNFGRKTCREETSRKIKA